ncbi:MULTISPECIES: DUF3313 domain-containing protein [unclassified Pseudomonas]|uniref:DUF3313 domain-containing protein n=1 Tax=unclassified Pseudomonas TaxID=196821 RepID=UPI000A1E73F9|nr:MULTISPECIES: DUF3313 domain-containing protein [unclassified Pseudomonas]
MRAMLLNGLLWAATVGLTGCAGSQVEPGQYSGFLRDYSHLQPGDSASGKPVMRWVDAQADFSTYTRIYIEPSQLYPAPITTAVISGQTLQSITQYFDEALKREFGKKLKLVNAPGPDTIVMRPAITAVSTHNEGLKPYEFLPLWFLAATVNTAAGGRDQTVEIATEAEFLDGNSHRLLAQVVRKSTAHELENDKQRLTVNDVKSAIDGWAGDMRQGYEKLRSASR